MRPFLDFRIGNVCDSVCVRLYMLTNRSNVQSKRKTIQRIYLFRFGLDEIGFIAWLFTLFLILMAQPYVSLFHFTSISFCPSSYQQNKTNHKTKSLTLCSIYLCRGLSITIISNLLFLTVEQRCDHGLSIFIRLVNRSISIFDH